MGDRNAWRKAVCAAAALAALTGGAAAAAVPNVTSIAVGVGARAPPGPC